MATKEVKKIKEENTPINKHNPLFEIEALKRFADEILLTNLVSTVWNSKMPKTKIKHKTKEDWKTLSELPTA